MSVIPIDAAGREYAEAFLRIVEPPVPDPVIWLKFNPAEYQLTKANTFAEIPIPGLGSPPLQFVRGGAETLSMEAVVDTSDTGEDVRFKYVDRIRGLLARDEKLHAPPIVAFHWDRVLFTGVLANLTTSYVLFDERGVPLRARLTIAMTEYRPVAVQVLEEPTSSPDVEKTYTVTRGETLASVAHAVYADAGRWRVLAEANAVADPRTLPPGLVLTVPRLR